MPKMDYFGSKSEKSASAGGSAPRPRLNLVLEIVQDPSFKC